MHGRQQPAADLKEDLPDSITTTSTAYGTYCTRCLAMLTRLVIHAITLTLQQWTKVYRERLGTYCAYTRTEGVNMHEVTSGGTSVTTSLHAYRYCMIANKLAHSNVFNSFTQKAGVLIYLST